VRSATYLVDVYTAAMLWACNFETTDGSSTLCTVETGMRSVELSSTLREEDLWLA